MDCVICKESTKENLIKVTERGLGGLLQFSKIRDEDSLHEELRLAKSNQTPVFVHESCRKRFNNKRRIAVPEPLGKKTRKSVEVFGWKINCFYCGLQCIHDLKNPKRKDWHLVTTLDIRQRILDICKSKLEDNADDCSTLQIHARIMSCIDLIAAEARYHQSCSLSFLTKNETSKSNQKGRPRNENMMDVFQQACEWLEATAEMITLTPIKAAANLIKAEIREKDYRTDIYPTSDEIKDDWIPESLRLFLGIFTNSRIQKESIGQCIVKTVTATKIPPILFALAVEVDHLYGSRWLNDELFKLGFAISYSEVKRFKQASLSQPVDQQMKRFISEDGFTHFIADNVDHNISTLDGHGTFHGMGIVASTISRRDHAIKEVKLNRPSRLLLTDEVTSKGSKVPIINYHPPKLTLFEKILFKPRVELLFPYVLPSNLSADSIWKAAGLFSTEEKPRPSWSGYMQDISTGHHPPKSSITMLPIIDLNPSDRTCIYSTLLFVINQSRLLNVETPSITFDQPLWEKAIEIVVEKSLNIVVHLGGFHTLMSFAGSIGSFMNGSGLECALQTVYGENSVKHMLHGKAIARATRGHILVEAALTLKLQQLATDADFELNDKLTPEELNEIEVHCKQVSEKEIDIVSVPCQAIKKLDLIVASLKTDIASKSRTAKLWLQYMEYVDIMRQFIRASRSGDWNLHLITLNKMLNLFAGTGHIHYAKSARLYLQRMLELPRTHPWMHQKLAVDGFHVIRRSERYWAGLWPDLVIEQVFTCFCQFLPPFFLKNLES